MSAAGRKMADELVESLPPPDRLKKSRTPGEEGEGDDEEYDGAESAASALMAAMKSDDPAAFAAAFKDMMDTCRE